jgi:class 3 adenylate cyclase
MLERKLATILSADVAEYSRLMAEDEEQTLRTFRAHSQIFESLVALHRGRIFNTAGDAILAEFTSAVEAVRCATEIQAALRTRNDQLPPARQVRFRIGVNLGDVMVQNLDLLGDGVNVAARLQGAAEPGGICISGSVYDQIRNKLSLTFASLGERSFKNIPQPVRTFSITGTDSHGELPATKGLLHSNGSGRIVKWAAAIVPLLVLAGGYWVYVTYPRIEAEQPRPVPDVSRRGLPPSGQTPQLGTVQPTVSPPVVTASPPEVHPPAIMGAQRFDGSWTTTLSCPPAAGALGYSNQFTAQVKDGHYYGSYGTPGQPSSLTLDGKIQPDGTADIYAKGFVGSSAFAVGNVSKGTPYGYHITGRFEGSKGTGNRVEGRPCNFDFVRQ